MTRKRITFVQVGNYAEAYERFRAGGGEDFFAQRYSVDFVAALAGRADVEQITQLCISAEVPEQRLDNGIRQVGLLYRGPDGRARTRELCDLVFASKPTHLIVNSPITALIRRARKAGIDVFPLLADSFRVPGIKARIRYALLAHELKHPAIRVVTNRNLNASRDLERIGVPPGKIVPFDWPPVVKPSDFPVKTRAVDPATPRLVYVGQVRVEKGVGDLVDAVAALKRAGREPRLTIVGAGEIERFQRQARDAGVEGNVVFAGKLIHPEVLRTMHEGDVVLVPSRHEYPEGMPNVIYEGLCSRTPLVVSDHPMFGTRVRNGEDCLVFPAGDVGAMVASIERLLDDPAYYATLSAHAEEVCARYMIGAPWGELIEHWLGGTAADKAWLDDRALDSPRFR